MGSPFFSRRMLTILVFGFSSGMPLALTGATLQAWMKTENVDLTTIGLFSLVGLPYAFKFVWAPLMDRFVPPFWGRRRSWVLLSQFALVLAIACLGFSDPVGHAFMTAFLAVIVSFFSASQDIVVDAYRTDLLGKKEQGPGAAIHIMGYRIAMLFSGAVALILADRLPWKMVYFIMAAAMGVGVLMSFLAPEPQEAPNPPKSLTDAIIFPFIEFFKRPGAVEILIFVVLYKLDVVIATALTTPFMMELGFTKTDIGAVTKGFGLVATILGTLTGGALMVRWGLRLSLWSFGIFQAVSGFSFAALATLGHHYPMMVVSIAAENFCSGMGTAAFSAFLMRLCDKRFTATQFALLTSLMALTRIIGGAPTGFLAKSVGWPLYFMISVAASVPGLLLLTRYSKWANAQEALREN
ncbi:AmpG family muropeptide MFS transporter [Bdellovibrionota bacterium FG-2]